MKLIPLSEKSPRDLPFEPSFSPWPHQAAMIRACIELEKSAFGIEIPLCPGVKYEGIVSNGLLAAAPGSGKTNVVLTLIQHSELAEDRPRTLAFCGGTAFLSPVDPVRVQSTLVVTGPSLTIQWETSAKNLGFKRNEGDLSFKTFVSFKRSTEDVGKKRPLVKDANEDKNENQNDDKDEVEAKAPVVYDEDKVNDALSGRYKMVLLTANAYKELSEWPEIQKRLVDRLVFDEADSIEIPNLRLIPFRFMWLVTGTPDCFHTNDRSGLGAKSNIKAFDGLFKLPKSVAEGQTTFEYVFRRQMQEAAVAVKTIFCEEAFIEQSWGLDPVQMVEIESREPAVEELKAWCAKKFNRYMIAESLQRFKRIALGQSFNIDFVSMVKYLDRYATEDDELKLWMRGKCAYTLRETPTVHLSLISPDYGNTYIDKRASDVEVESVLQSYSCVSAVLEKVRQHASEGAKVILFTEQTLEVKGEGPKPLLISELERLEIKYGIHRGNRLAMQKRVTELEKGSINLLILKRKAASGLNLQFCSHIVCAHDMSPSTFKQLVARGQRPGRTGPLVVYHMQNLLKPKLN